MNILQRRWLFVATIVLGSFLLFMVQPMIARLALPRLGGAPNVWNSAMLVFQTLLLAGYGYAHGLILLPPRAQRIVHVALLALAALSLPIALADLAPAAPGWEVVWVPALILVSIGPVFLLLSAQAPLMQSWFLAGNRDADPYWLYAASNVGSLAGLLAYPLLMEPAFGLIGQARLWSAGFVFVIGLAAGCALATRGAGPDRMTRIRPTGPAPDIRRIGLWLALSAVPSGLMLSTTNYLTTDIFAMPLLWVIPLALYLLSFVIAFASDRRVADWCVRVAPLVLLVGGATVVWSRSGLGLVSAFVALATLLVVAAAMHARLYALRPEPARLTGFYLAMSVGGALGGSFVALIAPIAFVWVLEHPLLLFASALLLPVTDGPVRGRWPLLMLLGGVVAIGVGLGYVLDEGIEIAAFFLFVIIAGLAFLLRGNRPYYVAAFASILFFAGGSTILMQLRDSDFKRSYFGVYEVKEAIGEQRWLLHGTTLHGKQLLGGADRQRQITSYYVLNSGVGNVLANARDLLGSEADIGVVGLGAGTLACYAQPGQHWTFFEIDEAVVDYSRDGTFTFLDQCTPDARIIIGDARQRLATVPHAAFDLLVIDAFSSDAIPLHLMTVEAMDLYASRLSHDGVLMIHVSNRYFDLPPVIAAAAHDMGWQAMMLHDKTHSQAGSESVWIALTRREGRMQKIAGLDRLKRWKPLPPAIAKPWTDDRVSIVPVIRWQDLWNSM